MSGRDDPPPDPWSQARERARSDVAAALAPRRRTCPVCGAVQDPAATRRCRECGAELVARRPARRWRRGAVLAGVIAAIAVALPIVVVIGQSRERAAVQERAAAREQATLEAAERRRMIREGRPQFAALPASGRRDTATIRRGALRRVERLITADARARVRAGVLDGPVIGTRCLPDPDTPTRRALERDPAATRLVYGCIALKSRFEAPPDDGRRRIGYFGHPFRAVVEPRRRSVAWCRVFPPAGEGARSLAVVALDPACRARPPGARDRR